jgi:outer membrane protein TolC
LEVVISSMNKKPWPRSLAFFLLLTLLLLNPLILARAYAEEARTDEGTETSMDAPSLPAPLAEYSKDARPLSLKDALDGVLVGNHMIKASREEEGAAKAGFDYAKSFGLPRLDMVMSYAVSDNPVNVFAFKLNQARFTMQDFDVALLNDPPSTTNFNAGLIVKYPIYAGGRVQLGMDAAKDNIEASRQATGETSRAMLSNMLKSYIAGALLMETIKVLDESLLVAQKHVALSKSFYNHGLVVKSDVLGAEVYFSMTLQERNTYFGKLRNLNDILSRLMGSAESRSYTLECRFDQVPRFNEDPLALEETALLRRPDLVGYLNQRAALEKMMTIEIRSALPEVGLMGQVQHNDRGFFVQGSGDMTAGIYLSMPIFDGGQRGAKVREYQAKLKAFDEKIEMLRLSIRGEVREGLTDYHTALLNLEASEKQVEKAVENLRIISNRYKSGLSTSLDVQQSETMLRQARLARLSAHHDVQLAYYRISIAAGTIMDVIDAEKICEKNITPRRTER